MGLPQKKRPSARPAAGRRKPAPRKAAAAKPALPPAEPVAPPPPPPRPPATPAALDAALALAWAGAEVSTVAAGPLTLRVARLPSPRPHFHVVTRGLAPHGFEVSLKAPCGWSGAPLPEWCVPLFAQVAQAAQAGSIEEGQCVAVGQFGGPESELGALALVTDAALYRLEKEPRFPVLMAVGLTDDEAALVRTWSPQGLLEVLGKGDPLLVTDPARPSLLLSPRARAVIEQRAEKEGSSMAVLKASISDAKKVADAVTWRLDAAAAQTLVALLQGRLGHQRSFKVLSPALAGEVQPADAPSVELKRAQLSLKLNLSAARALRASLKGPGRYTWEEIPGLAIEVVETPHP